MNTDFHDELSGLINKYSKENGSDTPDFILANYLAMCLDAFDQGVEARDRWYGRDEKRTRAIQRSLPDSQ